MLIFEEKIKFFSEKKMKKRSKNQFLGNFVWNKKVKKTIKKVDFFNKKRIKKLLTFVKKDIKYNKNFKKYNQLLLKKNKSTL